MGLLGAGEDSGNGGEGCRGGVAVGVPAIGVRRGRGAAHGSTNGGVKVPGGAIDTNDLPGNGCVTVSGGIAAKVGAGKVDAGSGTPSGAPSSGTAGFIIAARTRGGAMSASPCKTGVRMSLARTKFISRCGADSA